MSMTCTTCIHKRVAGPDLRVLALCTPVMQGMTPEERASYDPTAPCKFWEPCKLVEEPL